MMNTENQNLYFIAIVLPEEISRQVIEVQKEFAERFDSRRSLRVMPHITLKAPFRLPPIVHNHLLNWFLDLVVEIPSFQLELKGFDAFKNPKHPVIYIKPSLNDSLFSLQRVLIQQFFDSFDDAKPNNTELVFRPHITVAYRDLQPEMFERAWLEFRDKKFSGTFVVNSFQLLKHDGKSWNIIRRYDLK
ncbi:2'-5' RNA ligase family protein [Dyadobacter sp. CY345]|uniref:2'-5' RNA ligase family protein n=1 Tax=Dyadobacter sp. CY345 TaxID=2909335 RepID=UPI001F3AFA8D|nr:2'-5' RNA ligase family protein [Dyadobacter sp. CY345]MCF2447262.1 2'-5' RNA ligase family protein [Dyadobacter sp. CY345]